MNAPSLLKKLLGLKLRRTLCPPDEVEVYYAEYDEAVKHLASISGKSRHDVEALVQLRWPEFVRKQHASGYLIPDPNPPPC